MIGFKPEYKTHRYISAGDAYKKAKQMKNLYGYMPSVFREKSPSGKVRFVVVQPRDLVRVR